MSGQERVLVGPVSGAFGGIEVRFHVAVVVCATCAEQFIETITGDPEEALDCAVSDGWHVDDEVALCPDCKRSPCALDAVQVPSVGP